MAKQILKITQKEITDFLKSSELFTQLPKSSISAISKSVQIEYIEGKKCLFKQNSASSSMYVLMYGLLCVIKEDQQGKSIKIGEIKSGSVVGEIGCLFDEKRTASIYAVRNSVLLKITHKSFLSLAKDHPEIIFNISKASVKRLVKPTKNKLKHYSASFSFIAAGGATQIKIFADKVCEKLNKYGKSLLLTQEKYNQLLGKVNQEFNNVDSLSFQQKLEKDYQYIIYVAQEKNEWAKHCIRQADKIFLIGEFGSRFTQNKIEALLPKKQSVSNPSIELVLLFNSKKQTPNNVQAWLKYRNVSNHYNIRTYKASDIERFARIITGNALGLVLSGGGSLGLAHVGVIQALQENKIPIDYIAGTSMGGLVGALLAIEYEHEEIAKSLEKQLMRFQKNIDYTLPIISLIKAKRLDSLLKESFSEDARIENLWLKYFCVSTNINTNEVNIHEEGVLWHAIRASLSLPGILPVVLNEKKEVLVDGGILNNLPVDIMQSRINSGIVLASSIKTHQDPPSKMSYDEYTSSGWHILFKHLLLPRLKQKCFDRKMRYINIASIIQNSMIIASNNHQQKMIELADYNIIMDLNNYSMIDFHPINDIISSGYKQAKQSLKSLNLKNK